ncbi:MAG TPA: S1C family serine protease [Acetobacteraceae bacterium]|jgi:S1-C subfamily serine protease|nr:S1C family serine protease [Acetobacteraceae bacterium]
MTDVIDQMSALFADRVAAVAPCVVAIGTGRHHASGILWRPDVVVASAQTLPDRVDFTLRRGGAEFIAKLAGCDPGTNVAALRLAEPIEAALPSAAPTPRVGSLAVAVGADDTGVPTARLAMVHATGPAWHSQAGGRIDALLRLDVRVGTDEGGPVLDSAGQLLGMSTAGPRRRALAIPVATIDRVLDPLLTEGRVARGWLGTGLQPVMVPETLRTAAGQDSGMMVMSLAPGGPAAAAGVLAGDILLDLDGTPVRRMRALAAAMGPEQIGKSVALRLLRAGALQTLSVTIAARPAA